VSTTIDQTITETFFANRCPIAGIDPARHYLPEWRMLNSLHGHLEQAATRALAEFGLSLVEFTVLDILEEQTNGHLRMQDVAMVAGLTTGATTRLVNRLEERGLLRRLLCEHDRRGIYTELTPEGRELLGRARPVHDDAIRDILTAEITAQTLTNIADAIHTR
jgi:DNA-binding MarR family transcriptional regulator